MPPAEGVFPDVDIHEMIEAGCITGEPGDVEEHQVQPASLDLTLGARAYRLRCSFVPNTETVAERLEDLAMGSFDLGGEGAILERNRPYLIPLREGLRLPPGVRARASPKSSTGRLDIFTRTITDRSPRFDDIGAGYHGGLWLEVASRSFAVKVRQGLSLNQLRLAAGTTVVSDAEIAAVHAGEPLLFLDDRPVPADQMATANGVFVSLDLRRRADAVVGYRARKNSELVDLSHLGHYEPEAFWEPLVPERGDRLVLEPEEFYLLLSAEAVRVPPGYAAEMTAYDPASGELRSHYAGFFDPGFGFSDDQGLKGSRATLEVRAHDVPFMVEHRQPVCTLRFERMRSRPRLLYGEEIGSHYQSQQVTLSKHFRRSP